MCIASHHLRICCIVVTLEESQWRLNLPVIKLYDITIVSYDCNAMTWLSIALIKCHAWQWLTLEWVVNSYLFIIFTDYVVIMLISDHALTSYGVITFYEPFYIHHKWYNKMLIGLQAITNLQALWTLLPSGTFQFAYRYPTIPYKHSVFSFAIFTMD